ncbi:MAG: hypothetical protein BGO32_12930 [Bacteroidetes bacterium 37-13]|nr:MAG: hypothetical protein BGO32_12930 [Bacteroidetes bacterium 37-13]
MFAKSLSAVSNFAFIAVTQTVNFRSHISGFTFLNYATAVSGILVGVFTIGNSNNYTSISL